MRRRCVLAHRTRECRASDPSLCAAQSSPLPCRNSAMEAELSAANAELQQLRQQLSDAARRRGDIAGAYASTPPEHPCLAAPCVALAAVARLCSAAALAGLQCVRRSRRAQGGRGERCGTSSSRGPVPRAPQGLHVAGCNALPGGSRCAVAPSQWDAALHCQRACCARCGRSGRSRRSRPIRLSGT